MSQAVSHQSSDKRAVAAIVDHHAQLRAELDERVGALRAAVADSVPYQPALRELRAFLETSVLPHANAEEAVLYVAARSQPSATLFVQAMIVDHRALAERTRTLADARSPLDALSTAEGAAAVFALHVAKENDLLLPLLARAPAVSVSGLLRAMQQRMGELEKSADRAGEARNP